MLNPVEAVCAVAVLITDIVNGEMISEKKKKKKIVKHYHYCILKVV